MDPGSVDVKVHDGTLTAHERFLGAYRRQLALGEGIDTSKQAEAQPIPCVQARVRLQVSHQNNGCVTSCFGWLCQPSQGVMAIAKRKVDHI